MADIDSKLEIPSSGEPVPPSGEPVSVTTGAIRGSHSSTGIGSSNTTVFAQADSRNHMGLP